jgi:hypothetical protein
MLFALALTTAVPVAGCGDDEDPEFPPIVQPEPPGTSEQPEPDPCHDEPTFAACQACVEQANRGGADFLRARYVEGCACGPETPCTAPCALPSGEHCVALEQPSTDCQTCLDALPSEDAPCVVDAITRCQANDACAGMLRSLQGCPLQE